jgi:hypothetical protein
MDLDQVALRIKQMVFKCQSSEATEDLKSFNYRMLTQSSIDIKILSTVYLHSLAKIPTIEPSKHQLRLSQRTSHSSQNQTIFCLSCHHAMRSRPQNASQQLCTFTFPRTPSLSFPTNPTNNRTATPNPPLNKHPSITLT